MTVTLNEEECSSNRGKHSTGSQSPVSCDCSSYPPEDGVSTQSGSDSCSCCSSQHSDGGSRRNVLNVKPRKYGKHYNCDGDCFRKTHFQPCNCMAQAVCLECFGKPPEEKKAPEVGGKGEQKTPRKKPEGGALGTKTKPESEKKRTVVTTKAKGNYTYLGVISGYAGCIPQKELILGQNRTIASRKLYLNHWKRLDV